MSDLFSQSVTEHSPMLPSAALARGTALQKLMPKAATSAALISNKQEWNALECGPFTLLFSRHLPCQILPATPLCRVPNAAPFLLGAFSVQGFVTPVFDLHQACGFKAVEPRHWLVFGLDDERLALAISSLPTRQADNDLQLLQSAPPLPPLLHSASSRSFHHSDHYYIELEAPLLFSQLADSAFSFNSLTHH